MTNHPLALSMLLPVLAAGCGGAPQPAPRTTQGRGGSDSAEAPPALAEDAFLEDYAATRGYRLGQPAEITLLPDGKTVLFLRSGPRSFVRNLYSYDAEKGEEQLVLTAEQLLDGAQEELSDEERARRERLRLAESGITRYQTSPDGGRLLVPMSGRLFVVARPGGGVTELPDDGGYANQPKLSPDGKKVACVREGDLYVIDIEAGTQRRLTDSADEHVTNGLAEFVAQEEMRRYDGFWWSPDSKRLAYQRTDTSDVETLYAADPMHPSQKPHASPYPRAGRQNAQVQLGVISVRGGKTRWVDWDRETYPYLATVQWTEGAPLTLVVQNRHQTEQRILAVDADGSETRTLHVEKDEAWINLDQSVPRWIDGGKRFLWSTERNGAWQLELRDREGSLLGALTAPDLGYEELLHVDEERGVAWVAASDEPTETHLWRVSLDPEDGPPERVSRERGLHDGHFGDAGQLWVHRSETPDRAARWLVRRGADEELGELASRSEEPPFEPNVEYVTVGERDFRALVVRPRNFDEDHRYPVIVSVYGGPHHLVVRATRNRYLFEQWIADHGFVVVSADGRGTPKRGREWERAVKGNLIRLPLEDQVAAIEALGARHAEMDLSRVGIFGWSFGGYFSAMAAMRKPDLFDVAVAGAPVSDWRDYDTHYTERYMGMPDENEDGYEDSSVLTWASELQRPLLVIHGTSDDNVYFTHAVKLSDALLRAERPHTFLPLSGFTHMVAKPQMARSLQKRIVGFLAQHLR